MNKKDTQVLEKILKEIEQIEVFVKGFNFESFMDNEMVKRSVAMTLINIGEKAKILSDEFKGVHRDIPFKAIVAMRNVAAHGYEELRFDYVWETVTKDLPDLKSKIEGLV